MKNNDIFWKNISDKLNTEELEKAHRDYELRKNEILTKIVTMQNDKRLTKVYQEWLNQIEEFIKEREI